MTSRPLTPLERALLRAVVDLGEEAYGVTVRRHAEASTGRSVPVGAVYAAMNRMEEEGFVRTFDVEGDFPERGGRARRYWRPAFDLTEVLCGEVKKR